MTDLSLPWAAIAAAYITLRSAIERDMEAERAALLARLATEPIDTSHTHNTTTK